MISVSRSYFLGVILFSFQFLLSFCIASQSSVLVIDDFSIQNSQWKPISLNENQTGNISVKSGRLTLSGAGYSGIYFDKPFSGHFVAEVAFLQDKNIGMAIIHEKNGQPDVNNFTMITVDRNHEGHSVVRIRDCQNGRRDVLDNTGELLRKNKHLERDWQEEKKQREEQRRENNGEEEKIDPDRPREIDFQTDGYEHILTGKKYSVPFTKTNNQLRIFRDGPGGFFHYYYSVKKTIRGKSAQNWMELAPSKDWAKPNQTFYVALINLNKGQSTFDKIEVLQKPIKDQDDRQTGFQAVRREYNWSGFFGPAVVISFDDAFKYHDDDVKWVFWEESNYVPAWHLNNQLQYTYEFMECWNGGNPGCHEPMSDRLNRWSQVKILENNPVRKVVHWKYALVDPDYYPPHRNIGKQVPEADEIWTFYPDGSATRYMVYTPKLDSGYESNHELGELIAIAGSQSHCSDFIGKPALKLFNLKEQMQTGHPGPKFDYYSPIDDWGQVIMATNLNNLPSPFIVTSSDSNYPDTYSNRTNFQYTWHHATGKHTHWPVGKRPYTGAFGSYGLWKAEVSHACLLSFGAHDEGTALWDKDYKVDQRGRKYRDWVLLVGLGDFDDPKTMKQRTQSWLDPGSVSVTAGPWRFVKNDRRYKALEFQMTGPSKELSFQINPVKEYINWHSPVLQINRCHFKTIESIKINGQTISQDQFRQHRTKEKNHLLWFGNTINLPAKITLSLK